jgi:hypothetical protein
VGDICKIRGLGWGGAIHPRHLLLRMPLTLGIYPTHKSLDPYRFACASKCRGHGSPKVIRLAWPTTLMHNRKCSLCAHTHTHTHTHTHIHLRLFVYHYIISSTWFHAPKISWLKTFKFPQVPCASLNFQSFTNLSMHCSWIVMVDPHSIFFVCSHAHGGDMKLKWCPNLMPLTSLHSY